LQRALESDEEEADAWEESSLKQLKEPDMEHFIDDMHD